MHGPPGSLRRLADLMRHLALLLLLVGLVCCGESASSDAAGDAPLRVGTEAAYPPFETVADDGTLVGLDIDLMHLIGEELGRAVEFDDAAFDALIPNLQAGRIEAICSGMSRTEERDQVIDFSIPYARVPMGVLVSTERFPADGTAADLDDNAILIAVQRGTSGSKKAAEAFPSATRRDYDREVDAASEVAAGRADAFVYDMVSVVKLHALHPDTTRILDADLGEELYAIGLAEGSALKADIDAFLRAERRPGGNVDALLEQWLGDAARFRTDAE